MMISETRDRINNAIFNFQISKKKLPNKLIVDRKTYETIKSYIGVVKKEAGFKEYFNDLEVIIDDFIKEFKVDYREED